MTFVAVAWEWEPRKVPCGFEPVRIECVRGRNGVRYAIRQSGACMDATGEWEYEPIPSSRDDAWLERFRFGAWEHAAKAVERYCTPLGRFYETYKYLLKNPSGCIDERS